jgi:Glycosyl transferase family 2
MRLVGVSMVRNEADIIEAFVRHNGAILDALIVVDHGSVDGTREILSALAEEGLAVAVESEPGLAQRQPEVLTRAARAAFAQRADAVFPLDADEFLKMPDRALLEQILASLPDGLNAALRWQTYVPDDAQRPPEQPLRAARRRLAVERHGLHKLVLTRAFATDADVMLAPGSHTIVSPRDDSSAKRRFARLRADVSALAHLPVRSATQLERKVTIGWLAHRAAHRPNPELAFHWRELYEGFAREGPPSPSDVATIAANYGIPHARWLPLRDITLVDDPLPPGMPSRYDHLIFPDAEARVRAFAEKLVQAS